MHKIALVLALTVLTGCASLTGKPKTTVIGELTNSGCQITSYHHVAKLGITDIKCEVYKYD